MSLIDLQTGQLQNVAQGITQLQALDAHAAGRLCAPLAEIADHRKEM